jgi:lauroyl/myristoyl acyltransferase
MLLSSETSRDTHEIAQRYLTYRKYLNYLERTWIHPAVHRRIPAKLLGQEYLDESLAQERGAILLSGHAYGFNRLVAPILGRHGYRVIRGGMVKPQKLKGLAGTNEDDPWTYVYLGESLWERLRALKRITTSLDKNELLHTLILGHPGHGAAPGMRFCGHPFSLDLPTFRFLTELKRPILPCFALCDDQGQVMIQIHAPLSSEMPAVSNEFQHIYKLYLKQSPEFVRFWKRLLTKRDFF